MVSRTRITIAFGFILLLSSVFFLLLLIGCPTQSDFSDYQVKEQVSTPRLNPTGGTYSSDQNVTIDCATSGATIRYTIDGSTPTSTSPEYNTGIVVSGNGTVKTIKAYAVKSGMSDSAVGSETYMINYSQVSTPQFDPVGGTYPADQNVTITCSTSGVTIYYTTDNTTPSTSSLVYSGSPVVIAGNGAAMTIKAYAVKTGMTDSTVSVASYAITYPPASAPQFNPVGGTYTSDQSVTISCATSGATIYYTTDNSTPTTSSTVYGTTIPVAGNGTVKTIKAMAIKAGMTNSSIASTTYTITYSVVATPKFSPVGGTYTSDQSVTISCTTSGVKIYYTTDNSTPTTSSTVYSAPIAVTGNGTVKTIKALAAKTGMANSAIASATYTISYLQVATPTMGLAAGTYIGAQSVGISCSTSGATIRYTLDGNTPTSSSMAYSSPINVTTSLTLKAIAYKSGMADSAVASGNYIIKHEFAYVANFNHSSVTAFEISSTGTLTEITGSPFTTGTYPENIVVDASRKFLYVTTQGSGVSAFAIDPVTGALSPVSGSPFAAGNGPWSSAIAPSGKFLYVANISNNNVSAFSVNSSTGVLSAVAGSPFGVSSNPEAIAIDSSSSYLYVANFGASGQNISAFRIDSNTGALGKTIPHSGYADGTPFNAGTNPNSMVFSGLYLYVTNNGSNDVSAFQINSSTGELYNVPGSPFAAGAHPCDLSINPTANYLYLINYNTNTFREFSIGAVGQLTGVSGSPFTAGANAYSVAVEPSGKFLYVANYADNNISAYSIGSGGAISRIPGTYDTQDSPYFIISIVTQ